MGCDQAERCFLDGSGADDVKTGSDSSVSRSQYFCALGFEGGRAKSSSENENTEGRGRDGPCGTVLCRRGGRFSLLTRRFLAGLSRKSSELKTEISIESDEISLELAVRPTPDCRDLAGTFCGLGLSGRGGSEEMRSTTSRILDGCQRHEGRDAGGTRRHVVM